jgi:pyridoxine kinase
MAKLLCISSQTVFGPVGNSAAVPAMQECGHEVLAVPTVVLSNHPGLGKPAGQHTAAALMDEMFVALTGICAFDGLAGVMTGYFSTAQQVVVAVKQIALLKKQIPALHVLVDPVIGDHGALYVPETVAAAIRDQLLPLATIATPNLFELQWLTGVTDIADAVSRLGVAETLVTSVPVGTERLATELHFVGGVETHESVKQLQVPHGTGDFLAGCYLARRVNDPAVAAFESAMARLEEAITKSVGRSALVVN